MEIPAAPRARRDHCDVPIALRALSSWPTCSSRRRSSSTSSTSIPTHLLRIVARRGRRSMPGRTACGSMRSLRESGRCTRSRELRWAGRPRARCRMDEDVPRSTGAFCSAEVVPLHTLPAADRPNPAEIAKWCGQRRLHVPRRRTGHRRRPARRRATLTDRAIQLDRITRVAVAGPWPRAPPRGTHDRRAPRAPCAPRCKPGGSRRW